MTREDLARELIVEWVWDGAIEAGYQGSQDQFVKEQLLEALKFVDKCIRFGSKKIVEF